MNLDRLTCALGALGVVVLLSACGGATPDANAPVAAAKAAPAAPTAPAAAPAPPVAPPLVPRPPLDSAPIAAATGGTPHVVDNVVKVTFPRDDVAVSVDGWKMPPFMGLTSWAAFAPGETAGVEAMVMGDLVLFEDEVSAAMSAALDSGLEITALHNHFFFDKPHVYFMHIGGEGAVAALGKGVKAALDAQRAVRRKAKLPANAFGPALPAGASRIDGAKLDAIFGVKGATKDGMYKATMGRKTRAACGCTVGAAMGVNTWSAFAGKDDDALVDGDFAVAETELQSVLKVLRRGGVHVVAIHSHMTQESPRVLFVHYWGRGKAVDLATVVKKALDRTAWDGAGTST